MRRSFHILTLVIFAANGFVGAGTASASGGGKSALLGVYYGRSGQSMGDVQALEAWQGKHYAVLNLFTSWDPGVRGGLFGSQLPNIWANGNVPMITWEPYTAGSGTPLDVEVQIAGGSFDSYIASWAADLKRFLAGPDGLYGTGDDRRAYLRFAHEMNANWYPWAADMGGNRPGDYIAMWRRVHDAFNLQGIDSTRLQWVWAPNRSDVGAFKAEDFYPGNAYVDWVGLDGYNRPPSEQPKRRTPGQVFDNMLKRVHKISSRPVAITEVATSSDGKSGSTDLAYKNSWIRDVYSYALKKNVKMITWFNQDKAGDWAVFGGLRGDTTSGSYLAYSAYRTAVSRPQLVGSNPAAPRLIDDASFQGAVHQ